MDVMDTISKAISLSKTTAETLNRLRRANEENADIKRSLDTLHTRSGELQETFNSIFRKLAPDVDRRGELGTKQSYDGRHTKQFEKSFASCIAESKNFAQNSIQHQRPSKVEKMPLRAEGVVSSTKADVFCKHFDTPGIPPHAALDYTTCDQNGEPLTAEGRLMQKVIALSRGSKACGVSAVGSHGMGGVGKTTALRGLCHVDEMMKLYSDGIFFLEFGEDANDEMVSAMIKGCVQNSGGEAVAKEMAKAGSLSSNIEMASLWFCKKKILLVCDDLWPIGGEDLGYVRHLKKLHRRTSGCVLVVSTRFASIAESVGNPTRFEPLEARGEKAREILLKAACDKLRMNGVTDTHMERLLDICDGLPLTLSIAGGWGEVDTELSDYPSLSHVVEASLKHCEQWRQGMRKHFQSFCVLQKQANIPIKSLSRLWDVSFQDAKDIVEKFEEASLLRLEACGEETGIRLHDLVLKLCQGKVEDDERRSWHRRL
eukprot:IDg7492t1